MPSGPKKRPAAAKKLNDTVSKTSTNPAEDQAVSALEAVPEMVSVENKGKETQTVDDQRTNIEALVIVNSLENVEKKTNIEAPVIVNSSINVEKETKPVDGQSVMEPSLIHSSPKKKDVKDGAMMVKPVESVCVENPDISTKEDQGSLKEPLKSDAEDQSTIVEVLSVDQNEKAGQEKMTMLLEQLLLISNEISCNAEKQLNIAMKLIQLLEELKGSKGM